MFDSMMDFKAATVGPCDAARFDSCSLVFRRAETTVKYSKSIELVCIESCLEAVRRLDRLVTIVEGGGLRSRTGYGSSSDHVTGGIDKSAIYFMA